MKKDLLWINEHRVKAAVSLPEHTLEFLFRIVFVWKEKFLDVITRTDLQYTIKSNDITAVSSNEQAKAIFLGTCDRYV